MADVAAVRRQLLKLTRTSWTLTYEALVAAFQHTADCVAWQIGVVLSARCFSACPGLKKAVVEYLSKLVFPLSQRLVLGSGLEEWANIWWRKCSSENLK